MRILFFGTPAVAVPFLELLAGTEEVVGAVTQPDKPAGRSLKLQAPPVKSVAQRLGIPVFQPERPSFIADKLKGLRADVSVVVAYGRLLKPDVLGASAMGALNVHFSLLPMFRGAAPIAWSLVKGCRKTGVTLFWLDEGMDTGPIFLQKETDVGPEESAVELQERLVRLGLAALEECLFEMRAGRARKIPQSGEASLAPKMSAEDSRVSLDRPAGEIHDLVRGMAAGPKAHMEVARKDGRTARLLVLKTRPGDSRSDLAPGTILEVEPGSGFLIQCGNSSGLWILKVQPEGKRPLAASDFLNGLRLKAGDKLTPR